MPDQQDTRTPAAPQGTPAPAATPTDQPSSSTPPAAAPATPARKYAGKYETPEALEEGYANLQSSLGKKTLAEELGRKVVEATGVSIDDLQAQGFTPEQIVEAMLTETPPPVAPQGNGATPPATPKAKLDGGNLRTQVGDNKVNDLEFELKLTRFGTSNPDAMAYEDEIREFSRLPAFRNKSPQEIWDAKVRPLIEKGKQAAYSKQDEKERANMAPSDNPVPTVDPSQDALKRFNATGHIDDGARFVESRLFPDKK